MEQLYKVVLPKVVNSTHRENPLRVRLTTLQSEYISKVKQTSLIVDVKRYSRINELLQSFCDRCFELNIDSCDGCNLKYRRQ